MITKADWKGSFTDCAKRGDEISEEIYYEMLNVMPPISLKGGQNVDCGFQVGEPDDHREDENGNWRARYMTFAKKDGKCYYYGINFAGRVS